MADSVAAAAAAQPATVGKSVIPLINRLQDIMARLDGDAAAGVELPQVAAIGEQSSGNSSVLEVSSAATSSRGAPKSARAGPSCFSSSGTRPPRWGEFLHAPGRRFHDFEHIKREIQGEQLKRRTPESL